MAVPPLPAPTREAVLVTGLTLLLATAGGVTFYVLSAPAAFLTGSAFVVTAAVILRVPVRLPGPLRSATFSLLGVMMGAGITPQGLSAFTTLPVAILGLLGVTLAATAASYVVLRRVGRLAPLEAFFGAVPGHFSLVMALSVERGARVEQVLMPQVTRLLILVAIVPFILGGSGSSAMRGPSPEASTPVDFGITMGIAVASSLLAIRLRIPAPAILGPMMTSAVLSGTGLVTITVPAWLAAVAFMVLGASIGARFEGVKRQGLQRMAMAALASFVAAFAVAMAASVLVAALIGEPLGAVFLGYAPGGLEAMIALSFLLGYDVAFVAVLHTARMILLSLAIPMGAAAVQRRSRVDDVALGPRRPD